MPIYAYEVRDPDSKLLKGTLEALTQERAVRSLQEQLFTVISVVEKKPIWNPLADLRRWLHRLGYERVDPKDTALFTRQLALLMGAGIPITQTLEGLGAQKWATPYFNQVCNDLLQQVHEGYRLSVAMRRHRRVFSETYISLVRAGEASGAMLETLSRLSDYLERNYKLSEKLRSALVYPAMVFTISVVMVFFLCSYVFPQFLSFFQGMAIQLPATTRSLIAVATALGNPWVLLAFGSCLPLLAYQAWLLAQIGAVRSRMEEWVFQLPVFGWLFVQLVSARFSRTASILLDCGLGQMQTLDLLGEVVGSRVVAEEVEAMRRSIADGQGNLSSELLLTRFFPPICGHMVAAAEEAGNLPVMFGRLADFFDEAVEDGIQRVLAMVEPLMLLFMGGLVAMVLLAVFQPIYSLLEAL